MNASRCPYLHGTVDAAPFPGYVHGKRPAVCPRACAPRLEPAAGETPTDTLLREAREFCALFHAETSRGDGAREARWAAIAAEVAATGSYELTFDELEHGARVAWRNAPKCANRSKHMELTVADHRGVTTNAGAFAAILELLEGSIASGATTTRMCVFRARRPGEKQGPRIWNGTLLRFAGYEGAGGADTGGVLGEQADAALTTALVTRFGWAPPSPRSPWDVLPLLLQLDETAPPALFELPSSHVPIVPIRHPGLPALDALALRWFGIPVVSGLELSVGGLAFTAAPFVGWFADTEVVRDLTDACRYNCLPAVAAALGLNTGDELWKDEAVLAVNQAVAHSFRDAGFAFVGHHTLVGEFVPWYRKELRTRGYCPGNWKWIVPPMAASLTDAYLGLSKMTEYTLRPAILPPRPCGWRHFDAAAPPTGATPATRGGVSAATRRRTIHALWTTLRASQQLVGSVMVSSQRQRASVLVCHASVTGTAALGAARLRRLLADAFVVSSLSLADFTPAVHASRFASTSLVLFVTSTYGSGAPPPDAGRFLAWAASDAAADALGGVPVGVLGYGSSAYPRFCAAADAFHRALTVAGARPVCAVGRIDALGGGEAAFTSWTALLARSALASVEAASSSTSTAAQLAALEKAMGARQAGAAGSTAARSSEWEYVQALGLPPAHRATRWPRTIIGRVVHVQELLCAPEPAAAGPPADGGGGAGAPSPPAASAAAAPRSLPAPVRSVVRVVLSTAHVAGGVAFAPGDNVAVFPRQSDAAVARAAAAFGLAGVLEEDFTLARAPSGDGGEHGGLAAPPPFPSPTSLRVALSTYLSLEARPSADDLLTLAPFASGEDAATLRALLDDSSGGAAEAWVARHGLDWPRLFEALPSLRGAVPPRLLVTLIPPQHARHYSVSCSPSLGAGLLELTVALNTRLVAAGSGGGGTEWRDGVCSAYLRGLVPYDEPTAPCSGARAAPGLPLAAGLVELRVIRVPSFRLPVSHKAPVLAVASGSGLAPFRGFWQERLHRVHEAARSSPGFGLSGEAAAATAAAAAAAGAASSPSKQLGPFVLLHGCRSPTEQLYKSEVAAAVAAGAITEAHSAFSRAPGVSPKTYVQHLLSPASSLGDRVRAMLDHPKAAVFVCGDSGMANSVAAALEALLGPAALATLRATGRYHEEVFGIIIPASAPDGA